MANGRKDKTAKGSVTPLRKFGEQIEVARKAVGETQERLAERLSETLNLQGPHKVSQSYIARLERGIVFDPGPALLDALAAVFSLSYEELVAHLISDKYHIPIAKLSPLRRAPLSLDEIALWEKQTHPAALWIVATKYVDKTSDRFRDAIIGIIRDGGHVTFFIPPDPGFGSYKRLVLHMIGKDRTNNDDLLIDVPLDEHQLAVMVASYVIANPQSALDSAQAEQGPTGYLILNDENGEPYLGLMMYRAELANRIFLLNDIRNEHLRKQSATGSA